MVAHNQEIARLVTRRFEQWRASDEGRRAVGIGINEGFHDSHRYELSKALRRIAQCIRQGQLPVAQCEAEATASSVWPELLRSAGWRALFGHEGGLVWRHLRRYSRLVGMRDGDEAGLSSVDHVDVWATFHANGVSHGSHSHDGSSIAGVYYVREAGDGEAGGQLRIFDPRHIELASADGTTHHRRVTAAARQLTPSAGLLAMWPAYLQHEVTPTTGASPRISLAFDPLRRARQLNRSAFYALHARPGLPVLLEGAAHSRSAAEAARHSQRLRECCIREYEHKAARHRNVSRAGCDAYDPDDWCRDGVQICGLLPQQGFDCKALAARSLSPTAEELPTDLLELFDFPPPLPPLRSVGARFGRPFVFWSLPGATFGGENHFDMLCTGTLSVQHHGRKRWALWAPWDLRGADGATIPAHTRYEGVAEAGDVLYYPPAWFHKTHVAEGSDSLTAAVDLEAVPAFGTLGGKSLHSPFGYGPCASAPQGWHATSALWDGVLLGGGGATAAPDGRAGGQSSRRNNGMRDEL